jgi:hypothetical protein
MPKHTATLATSSGSLRPNRASARISRGTISRPTTTIATKNAPSFATVTARSPGDIFEPVATPVITASSRIDSRSSTTIIARISSTAGPLTLCSSRPLTTSIVLATATPTPTNTASVLVHPYAVPATNTITMMSACSTSTASSVDSPTRAIVRMLNSRPIMKNSKITFGPTISPARM